MLRLSFPLSGDLKGDRRGDVLHERLVFFRLPLLRELPEDPEVTLSVPLSLDLLSIRGFPRLRFEERTFRGDSDRSRILWRRPSFLRLFDNDEEGDLDRIVDLLQSLRLFCFVINFGGDRDRDLVLPRPLLSFSPRPLDVGSLLDPGDDVDELLRCFLLLLFRVRFDNRPRRRSRE